MDLATVEFDITARCNLRCKHCGSPAVTDEKYPKREMSTKRIRRLLKEMREAGCLHVILGGGEPFIRRDIFEILEETFNLEINVTLLTNGILLNQKKIKKLNKLPNLSSVRISMDYIEEEKFDEYRGTKMGIQILKHNLNLLKKEDIITGINATIFPQNIDQVRKIVAFATHHEVSYVRLVPLVPIQRGRSYLINFSHYVNTFREILSSLKEYEWALGAPPSARVPHSPREVGKLFVTKCPAGITSCAISPNGVVKFCPMFEDSKERKYDVKIMGFLPAWKALKLNRVNLDRKLVKKLEGKCSTCEEKTRCLGGCFIEKVARGRGYEAEQEFCLLRIVTKAIEDKISDPQTRKILSTIITRQERFHRAGFIPCVRSLPLWIHPL